MSSHIKDWDAQQVVEWLNGVYKDNPKRAAKLGAVIEEDGFTGAELLKCDTVEKLAEALETKTILIESLFEKIQAFKGKLVDDAVDKVAKSMAHDAHNGIASKINGELNALIEIFRDSFGIKSDDDEKEQMNAKDEDSTKSYREMIKDMAKDLGNFMKKIAEDAVFKDFMKKIVGIRMRKSVAGKIIEICYDYRALLSKTADEFGKYSSEISALEQLMHQISYTFSLPLTVIKQIDGMDAKNKQMAIAKLRKQTTEQLRGSTKKFNGQIRAIRKTRIPKLTELSDAWTDLSKRIAQLLQLLPDSGEQQWTFVEKLMTNLKDSAKLTAGFCLKWVVAPLTWACNPYLGTKYAMELKDMGDQLMESTKEKNIRQIKMMETALRHMGQISAFFGDRIGCEIINFRQIEVNDPQKKLKGGGFTEHEVEYMLMNDDVLAKMAAFGNTLLRCTKHLNKSRENIDLVEKTCAEEMNSFSVNIVTPLIDMLTSKK